MNATASRKKVNNVNANTMMTPAVLSIVLHVFVFVLGVAGIPYISKKPPEIEVPITVELFEISDVDLSDQIDEADNSEENVPTPPPKPVYNNTDSVPEIVPLKEPERPNIEEIPLPPEKLIEPIDKTEIKEPPKPKPKPKIKPKPKPVEKKPEEPSRDISSILKSLTPDEAKPDTNKSQKPETNSGQKSNVADFSKQLTSSELSALNAGVSPCWNINAGSKFAEELVVSLRVFVNPDQRVRDVQILDQLRYNADTYYRAAADSARRALLNPRCSTLNLPPEKYEQWKVFKYHFDPSEML